MRRLTLTRLGPIALSLLLACGAGQEGAGAEDAGARSADRPSSAGARAAAEAAARAGDVGEVASTLVREATGGGAKAFELEVSGEGLELPTLEGSSVMATSIANANVHYSFLVRSGQGSASMALRGGTKDPLGTHDPVSLSVLFLEDKLSCGYSSVGGKSEGELAVKIVETDGGVRGEIAGDVVCRPMKGGATGGPWQGRVEGWFER